MIKFFSQRGRGSLAMLLLGCALLILIGLLCLMVSVGPAPMVAQTVGFILLGLAAAMLLVLGLYLVHRRVRVGDLMQLIEQHQADHRRMMADAGSLRIRSVGFRQMSRKEKFRYVGICAVGVMLIVLGLLDLLRIWPAGDMQMHDVRGGLVTWPRWASGLLMMAFGGMTFVMLTLFTIRIEDDWSESLKKLFRDFNIT